ncbi:SusC/RagA family TonB-linked outer membrane protein [Filimonas effusa]|uniref:SusC/RagA family TonB-linked outer membrane protein n=2 Tax=Filimonas effusa TaxID=2508721 RepID=A0A4Q1DCM5_9BACT|nr:SusC/RagA family TonB-linked outer membrane protein [Filimonas effusa]
MKYKYLLLKIMRITFLQLTIIFTLLGHAMAYDGKAQAILNKEISINVSGMELGAVLKLFQDEYHVNFVYGDQLIDVKKTVSVYVQNRPLSEALSQILTPLQLTFDASGDVVAISAAVSKAVAAPFELPAPIKISGKVADERTGDPLAGVTIKIKGTAIAVTTNLNGTYTLSVPKEGTELVFSFVGYENLEVTVGKTALINVNLKQSLGNLNDVIVVGYSVQKRVNVIGAVATVDGRELENRPVTNLSTALAGLASGVYVRQSTGRPGYDGASINIRGLGTTNNTAPLVVIDGIVGSMDAVNPNDVESISVLKDAATAAIYGSLASNGVILITTKKGTRNKTTVRYSTLISRSKPNNVPEFVSDYVRAMQLVNEGYTNIGQARVYTEATMDLWRNAAANPDDLNANGVPNHIAYPNTNWGKELFSVTTPMQNHNLALNGGNENSQYLLSLQYLKNPGTIVNTGANRYGLRVNLQTKIAKILTVGTQTFGDVQKFGVNDLPTAFAYLTSSVPGIYPYYNGNYGFPAAAEESATANNPLSWLYSQGGANRLSRINTTVFANLNIVKGLTFETKAHYDNSSTEGRLYTQPYSKVNFATGIVGTAPVAPGQLTTLYSFAKSYNVILDAVLRYQTVVAGHHSISTLAGYNQQYFNTYSFNATKQGLLDPSLTTLNAGTTLIGATGDENDYAMRSYFGQLNYTFKDRYLFQAVVRNDGSSRFSSKNRWGLFPSFSGGYKISSERFMKGINRYVSNLKIRGSWGRTGNNASQGNYDYQATYNSVPYSFNGQLGNGLVQTKFPNPGLLWETTTTINLGLDGTLLRDALSFEIDVYRGKTEDILAVPQIPNIAGTSAAPTLNLAGVLKKGVELTLSYNVRAGALRYNVKGNIAYNTNSVIQYSGTVTNGPSQITKGYPINSIFLFQVYKGDGSYNKSDGTVNKDGGPKDGMIRTPQDLEWLKKMVAAGYTFQPSGGVDKTKIWYGDLIYADRKGDGIYGNAGDQYYTGKSANPKWNYGLSANLSYKGFDMSMIWAGSLGMFYYWNALYLNQSIVGLGKAVPSLVADSRYYYNEANPADPANNINGKFPRLKVTDPQNTYASDFFLYNASYLKLKNLQIGYTVSASQLKKVGLSNIRIFAGGENLLTITKYPGLDPEIGPSLGYPTMRQFTLGLNVTF